MQLRKAAVHGVEESEAPKNTLDDIQMSESDVSFDGIKTFVSSKLKANGYGTSEDKEAINVILTAYTIKLDGKTNKNKVCETICINKQIFYKILTTIKRDNNQDSITIENAIFSS
eukprot:2929367-Ditylum_brightwellii.AAC.1